MNHPHLPRSFIILFILLVVAVFSIGTLRAFTPAHAVASGTVTPLITLQINIPPATPSVTPPELESETLISTPTATILGTPTPVPKYFTDMTGIIALAFLMVVVILVGVAWGGRIPRNSHTPKP